MINMRLMRFFIVLFFTFSVDLIFGETSINTINSRFFQNFEHLKKSNIIPVSSKLISVNDNKSQTIAVVSIPLSFLNSPAFDEYTLEQIVNSFVYSTDRENNAIKIIKIYQQNAKKRILLNRFLPVLPRVPQKPYERILDDPLGPVVFDEDHTKRANGFLKGKHIYISQCHGWYYSTTLNRWATQRGNTHGIVEDFVNPEGVNQYLIQYFLNAGATVFTVREPDMNTNMVIVDDADKDTHPENGIYEEFGTGFDDSTQPGFKNFTAPYKGEVNPMQAGGNRYVFTSETETAYALWTPNIPKDGYYNVYISYSAHQTRAGDAHYTVFHAGGKSEFKVDQKRHGQTWVFLGRFYFFAGFDSKKGAVKLSNDSQDHTGKYVVSFDAVRFGGGTGDIVRGPEKPAPNSPTSTRPRWEEASRYYIQFAGAPSTVYNAASSDNNDDVGARSRYTAWQHEGGEDAVYISWHTNAPDGGTGTSTFVYGPNPPNGQYDFSGIDGSAELAIAVHSQIVGDIRKQFDPDWKNRGIFSAWFGELNPNNNPETPSILTEVAFHATAYDAEFIKEPAFRKLVSRAFYKGVVRYFAERDKIEPHFQPEPPQNLSVQASSDGTCILKWDAPPSEKDSVYGDPADGYIVYHSDNGHGFDNGTDVKNVKQFVYENCETKKIHYFRVSAYNLGGESFLSHTAAAYFNPDIANKTLVVFGFDRLDKYQLVDQDLAKWGLGTVERMFLNQMNTFDYITRIAPLYKNAGISFDSAWHNSVVSGNISLDNYSLVNWCLGEESTVDETFSPAEQALIDAYVTSGNAFIASGSEIGWDLDNKGTPQDKQFFNKIFGANYAGDDAETFTVIGKNNDVYLFDDGSKGTYLVDYPDLFAPLDKAEPFLFYDGESSKVAGITNESGNSSVVLLGFPLETIYPLESRIDLFNLILAKLNYKQIPDIIEPVEETEVEPIEETEVEPIEETTNDMPTYKIQSDICAENCNTCNCNEIQEQICNSPDSEQCTCNNGCTIVNMSQQINGTVFLFFLMLMTIFIILLRKQRIMTLNLGKPKFRFNDY